MEQDNPIPMELLEEMIAHPADITLETVQRKLSLKKHELFQERQTLMNLPIESSDLETIKASVRQKHDEFMDLLKTEERISKLIDSHIPK